jgi:excisionase family DNA binding protein
MNNDQEWVSLRQAAEVLGVHPATVRNWADKGDLPSRRTPGGHRRFRMGDVRNLVQQTRDLPPMEVQVIIQNALGQTRMQVGDGTLTRVAWYEAMQPTTHDHLRVQGRRVLEELRGYMAGGGADAGLAAAISLGKDYAKLLIADGLTLPQAVRGFFYFSDFVTNAVLTWSELTPPHNSAEWAAHLRLVNNFIHAMLLSIIEYYEAE